MPTTNTATSTRLRVRSAVGLLFVFGAAAAFAAAVVSGYHTLTDTETPQRYACASAPDAGDQKLTPRSAVASSIDSLAGDTDELRRVLERPFAERPQRLTPAVTQLLERRKLELLAALEHDPVSAFDGLFTDAERVWLAAVTENCVEQGATLQGTVEVASVDFDDGSGRELLTLTPTEGRSLLLARVHPTHSYRSNQTLTLTGWLMDGRFLFDDALQPKPDDVRAFSAAGVLGAQKTLVLMANFKNTTQPANTWDSVYGVIFDPTARSVNAHTREGSWNITWLTGAVNDSAASGEEGDIYGWYSLDVNQNCDTRTAAQLAMVKMNQAELAAGRDIDFKQYQYVILIAPFNCGWGGLASLGPTSVSTPDGVTSVGMVYVPSVVNIYNGVNTRLVGHELGHAFGNHHAEFFDCKTASIKASGCFPSSQQDYYDIMGKSTDADSPRHYNAIHKEIVGWFDATRILKTVTPTTVTPDGRYTLAPMESDVPSGETQIKALKIRRTATDFLYVEYRQPIGFDSNMDFSGQANPFEGALIHTGPYGLASYLIDADVPTGQKSAWYTSTLTATTVDPTSGQPGFVDPISNIRINIIDHARDTAVPTNSRLTVELTIPGAQPTANPTTNPTTPTEPVHTITPVVRTPYLIVAPARKAGATVRIFDQQRKAVSTLKAFPSKTSAGATVALGDVNADGSPEIIAGSGEGSVPRLRVFSFDGKLQKELFPFSKKDRTGIQVAAGDLDGDGRDELLATPLKNGRARIIVYRSTAAGGFKRLATATVLSGNYRGGLHLTTGDLDGDGRAEVVATPAGTANSTVRIYRLDASGALRLSKTFRVFGAKDRFGVTTAVADVDGDGAPEIAVARGKGAAPTIRIYSPAGQLKYTFNAASSQYRNGVVLAAIDTNDNGRSEIVTAVASNGPPNLFFFDYDPATRNFPRLATLAAFGSAVRYGLRLADAP